MSDAYTRTFRDGDRVWYLQPAPGGYGYPIRDVPAVFVRYTASRCRVVLAANGGKGPRVFVHVSPENVFARDIWKPIDELEAASQGGTNGDERADLRPR